MHSEALCISPAPIDVRPSADASKRPRDLVRDDDPAAVIAFDLGPPQIRDGRFVLTVVGNLKSGESTLDYSPLDRLEDFSAPTN